MTSEIYDMSMYMENNRQNATQMMVASHATVKSLTGEWKGLAIKFTRTMFSPLGIYLMTCTQQLSTVMELTEF
jgi:hypothetical protein